MGKAAFPLPSDCTGQSFYQTGLGLAGRELTFPGSWKGTQPEQLTPTSQKNIRYHMESCSVYIYISGELAGGRSCQEQSRLGIDFLGGGSSHCVSFALYLILLLLLLLFIFSFAVLFNCFIPTREFYLIFPDSPSRSTGVGSSEQVAM